MQSQKATNGPVVNESLETSVPGVFAAGNVLHVHDLVDFVSEEAEIAGKAAAEFIAGGQNQNVEITVKTDGKIRYTVPQTITQQKDVTVYFRVSDVFKNVRINVTDGENKILSKKKQRVAPGEMESVTIKGEQLANVNELHFSLEVL